MPTESRAEVRVVLVGRTGLDAMLRRDGGIELVRASTPLQAIGELASPIDAESPERAVVVVAPRVEGLLEGGERDDARAGEFVRALRVASPGVVVLAVRNGSPVPAAFDGSIASDLGAEALREAVRWRPRGQGPGEAAPARGTPPARGMAPVLPEDELLGDLLADSTPPAAERAPPRPPERAAPERAAPERAAERVPERAPERSASAEVPTDGALVAQLLRGQDVLPDAVQLIRRRLRDESVEFVPAGPSSGRGGALVSWEGMGRGGYGHLVSSVSAPDVLAPHARWLASWMRLRDQHAQLRDAAFTDPLTGAWNRRYFDRFLRAAIEQAREHRRHVTILLFDIDDFKKYNDVYGHDAGDEILRETVSLMRSVIRPSDRVCRVGGDEFAVIFHEPQGPRQEGSRHPSDIFEIARRFQEQVLAHRYPKLLDCAPATLTVSGGLASYPWDGATPEELLRRADQLAMASKRQGKNAITLGPGALRLGEV
ncbi:MAG: GGDEF domain-containing protein [Planctomycetota bacterium]|nr:GGDEF domain-containing protein [Planctomycetota bacterium]